MALMSLRSRSHIKSSIVLTRSDQLFIHNYIYIYIYIYPLLHTHHIDNEEVQWQWLANTLNPYHEANSLSSMINDDRLILPTIQRCVTIVVFPT